MAPKRNIIVVANVDDRTAATFIINELGEKYNIEASIWSANHYKRNLNQITNFSVIICVGGPGYNDITKEKLDFVKEKYKSGKFCIRTGNKLALVYGYEYAAYTRRAAEYFNENYLKKFVDDNFQKPKKKKSKPKPKATESKPETKPIPTPTPPDQPADTSKQPDSEPKVKSSQNDTKPIKEKTKIVSEDKKEYKSKSKYDKEFYKLDGKIWHIKYFNDKKPFNETKGLLYARYLMLHPNEELTPYELYEKVNNVSYEKLKAITSNQGAKTQTGADNTYEMIQYFEKEIKDKKEERAILEKKAEEEEAGCRDYTIIDNYMSEINKINVEITRLEELVKPYYNIRIHKRYDPIKQKDTLTKGIQTNMNNFYKDIAKKGMPDLAKELKQSIKHDKGFFRFNNIDLKTDWHVL